MDKYKTNYDKCMNELIENSIFYGFMSLPPPSPWKSVYSTLHKEIEDIKNMSYINCGQKWH